MIGRTGQSWQLILADLSLILFLVTLSALASEAGGAGSRDRAPANAPPIPHVAPAQALFRPDPNGPGIAQWLAAQPYDPRATVTIFAHLGEDDEETWNRAQALANEARQGGFAVRVIIEEGVTEEGAASDLYASLAYDAPGRKPR